ncbi:AMP-binding protein [Rhodococcus sp. ABRD24]|uniref:AMP-binding protein n=1 Tax=Rhodococcus sp. ABRD24 TaxID=2507582 RepID=UPI0013F16B51|nr:AMP-binding protein [Rhodococcus sp. ABRD24]
MTNSRELASVLAAETCRRPVAMVAPSQVDDLLVAIRAAGEAGVPIVLGTPEQRSATFGNAVGSTGLPIVELPVDSDGVRVLAATSGTTGRARFVAWTDEVLDHQAKATTTRICTGPSTRYGLALGVTSSYGFSVVNIAARIGGTVTAFSPTDHNGLIEAICSGSIDTLDTVPGVWRYLAAACSLHSDLLDAMTRLQVRGVGGEVVPHSLLNFYAEAGAPLHNGYGLTEAGPNVAISYGAAYGVHTVGTPLPGTGVRVTHDGAVLVSGPSLARRILDTVTGQYVDNPAVDADGWLDTGDVGAVDESGRLTILGRSDGLLVGHGKKLHSSILEETFRDLASDSADLVALQLDPHRIGRPRVVIAVIDDPATAPMRLGTEFTARARQFPPEFRVREIVQVGRDEVRTTASGKLDRHDLSALVTMYLEDNGGSRCVRTF